MDFYEDLFQELSKYGEIESLNICDNLADHMVGNVYVQFREDEHAATTLSNLTGRFYADFCEATCRQYEENTCNRGGYCNFMHLKKINRNCDGCYLGDPSGAAVLLGLLGGIKIVHMVVVAMEGIMMTGILTMKRGRRTRSRSPGRRLGGRSRSPAGRKNRIQGRGKC